MSEVTIKKYNETFVQIKADSTILEGISNYFTFKPDNYQFHPKYKAGVWDGKLRFLNMKKKNLFPQGLLFKLYAYLKQSNLSFNFVGFDKPELVLNHNQINKYAEYINFPHKLRDYQLQYIETGLKERKCVLCSPTATGKSAIIYFLHRIFLEKYKDKKVLIIVPTISLVEQMAGDFVDYSDENYFDCCQLIYSGKSKEITKNIVISTWQSLQSFGKEFFMQFDMLLVDECHGGANDGKVVKRIVEFCSRAKYKIGLSGTIANGKLNELSVNAIYGKIYQYTNTKREIERGNLTPLQITQISLIYDNEIKREFHKERLKIKQQATLAEKSVGASLYHYEVDFLNELIYRKILIMKLAKKQKDNILILYKRNNFGEPMFELLQNLDRKVFFVNGSTPVDDREKVRKICEENNDAVILANYKVFSTGTNIKRLHHIIFAESCKSKITILQSIGRGLRKHVSKEFIYIWDIIDVLTYKNVVNMMVKHAEERVSIYKKQEFDYKTIDTKIENFKEL